MHTVSPIIVWFRKDIRLEDNSAWKKAVDSGKPIIPVYIHSEQDKEDMGSASRWWLHHSLKDLIRQLNLKGSNLILIQGRTIECIARLVEITGSECVYWNRCYEPKHLEQDARLIEKLHQMGIETWSGNSGLMVEPWEIRNKQGKPYRVFSGFAKEWVVHANEPPIKRVKMPVSPSEWPKSIPLEELNLLPEIPWDELFFDIHDPSRGGAKKTLGVFLKSSISNYHKDRDIPSIKGTSQLSAALHWGQIGPREIMAALRAQPNSEGKHKYVHELAWREFAYYILYHFPETVEHPFKMEFNEFPWRNNDSERLAWQKGKTGYPIIDAGMRQLWQTGWMHNRVRMLVASFLVKHLLHSWKSGAAWFADTLVDADLANNTLGWQWVAGCGVDAAPYFRIFNPVTQGLKFDPDGSFVRRYLPELEGVPNKFIHSPWKLPVEMQKETGCIIGQTYPEPICGLIEGRIRALSVWRNSRN